MSKVVINWAFENFVRSIFSDLSFERGITLIEWVLLMRKAVQGSLFSPPRAVRSTENYFLGDAILGSSWDSNLVMLAAVVTVLSHLLEASSLPLEVPRHSVRLSEKLRRMGDWRPEHSWPSIVPSDGPAHKMSMRLEGLNLERFSCAATTLLGYWGFICVKAATY